MPGNRTQTFPNNTRMIIKKQTLTWKTSGTGYAIEIKNTDGRHFYWCNYFMSYLEKYLVFHQDETTTKKTPFWY